jgi:spoIIIJ-associated protein
LKDQVFSGRDVEEALGIASQALGLPRETLRYLVLDQGAAPGGASGARSAQVAVLLDRGGPPRPSPEPPSPASPDPLPRLRALIRALSEAAGLDLEVEVDRNEHGIRVRLLGAGSRFLLGGDGEVLRAVEHLLQRSVGHEGSERVRLECEGAREQREERLREQAAGAAEAVRKDGQPRTLGPLNSYERRIIHVALADAPGVRTFSVGEPSQRRVTIAPAGDDDGGGGAG